MQVISCFDLLVQKCNRKCSTGKSVHLKEIHPMIEKRAATSIHTDAECIHMHIWHFGQLIQVSGLHW